MTLLETLEGLGHGRIVCLRFGDGKILWSKTLSSRSESSPLVHNGRVFFGSEGGTLYALDARVGQAGLDLPRRRRDQGQPDAVRRRRAVLRRLRRLGARRAGARRRADLEQAARPAGLRGGNFYATAAVAYGRVYIGATDGRAYSLSAKDGRIAWAHQTGRYVYSSAAVKNVAGRGPMVFFGSYDGTFYALDARSGKVRWTHRSGGKISGSPTIVGDIVYYADLGRAVTVGLKVGSGKVAFRYPIGAYDPIVSDGVNLYLTGNRSLTALEPRRLYREAREGQAGQGAQEEGRGARARLPRLARAVPPARAVRAAGGGARAPDPDARLMAVTRPELGPTLPGALRERFGIPPASRWRWPAWSRRRAVVAILVALTRPPVAGEQVVHRAAPVFNMIYPRRRDARRRAAAPASCCGSRAAAPGSRSPWWSRPLELPRFDGDVTHGLLPVLRRPLRRGRAAPHAGPGARPGGPRAGQQRRRLRGRLRAHHRRRERFTGRDVLLVPDDPEEGRGQVLLSLRQRKGSGAEAHPARAQPRLPRPQGLPLVPLRHRARLGRRPRAYAALPLLRASRSTAASTPLTNPGASAPQNAFAVSTASSIAPSAGIGRSPSIRSGWSISSSAVRRIARSSGAIRLTVQPFAWRADLLVERLRVVGRRVRERARERRGVALEQSSSGRPVRSCWYSAKTAARR